MHRKHFFMMMLACLAPLMLLLLAGALGVELSGTVIVLLLLLCPLSHLFMLRKMRGGHSGDAPAQMAAPENTPDTP